MAYIFLTIPLWNHIWSRTKSHSWVNMQSLKLTFITPLIPYQTHNKAIKRNNSIELPSIRTISKVDKIKKKIWKGENAEIKKKHSNMLNLLSYYKKIFFVLNFFSFYKKKKKILIYFIFYGRFSFSGLHLLEVIMFSVGWIYCIYRMYTVSCALHVPIWIATLMCLMFTASFDVVNNFSNYQNLLYYFSLIF